MAILKQLIQEETGVNVSYWDTISIFYSKIDSISILVVGGWINQKAHKDGLDPVMTRRYELPSGLAPQLAAGADAFVKAYVKSLPEFEGSHDVN